MVELFANSGDPDQTPCSLASDPGLYCLPITLLGVLTTVDLTLFGAKRRLLYLINVNQIAFRNKEHIRKWESRFLLRLFISSNEVYAL